LIPCLIQVLRGSGLTGDAEDVLDGEEEEVRVV
jgi:hypothetical protein